MQRISDDLLSTTIRVSVASYGTQGNGHSGMPSISADGRYVAFNSDASNLVGTHDTNGAGDIFARDLSTRQTNRVSEASDGTQANSYSTWPSISSDGRYIAFISLASNLVSGDNNGTFDVFVHDRVTEQTTRASVASNGWEGNGSSGWAPMFGGPSISADGRYIAFYSFATNLVISDTNGKWDVFVHDQVTSQTTRVSVASDGTQGDGDSYSPSISADGRYVAFLSSATNLISGYTTNWADIFVRDLQTGQTTLVSVASDGTEGDNNSSSPSISADGRYVAFASTASNLVSGDTNGEGDVFVHDRMTGQTTRVSIASNGMQGDKGSAGPSISADGRYVAFWSYAINLVSSDTNGKVDIFVRDQATSQTTRVSVASDGTQGDSDSWGSAFSADGRYVAFESYATNLVSDDTNDKEDIFVHDRGETYVTYLPLVLRQ